MAVNRLGGRRRDRKRLVVRCAAICCEGHRCTDASGHGGLHQSMRPDFSLAIPEVDICWFTFDYKEINALASVR